MPRKYLTPLQAIKKYCRYECCANDIKSWKECLMVNCPLFPHRIGKRQKSKPKEFYFKKQPVTKSNSEKQAKLQEVSNG